MYAQAALHGLLALVLAIMDVYVIGSSAAQEVLRWHDEFLPCISGTRCRNGIDITTWSFEQGDGSAYGPYMQGWGNQELQCYTAESRNAAVKRKQGSADGMLALRAAFHPDGINCINPGAANSTRYWTSARMVSKAKAAFMWANATTAVRVEARLKVPAELGAWPAFWMLPNTNRTNCLACGAYGDGWCSSGEIDIMEQRNRDAALHSTIHYGGLKNAAYLDCKHSQGMYAAPSAGGLLGWTDVSVVWAQRGMRFYINGTLTHQTSSDEWYSGAVDKADNPLAPFDQPFYMIFNLAVGGAFPGYVTDTRRAPYQMLVDWVRVYDVPL